jgi:hypothetical protein
MEVSRGRMATPVNARNECPKPTAFFAIGVFFLAGAGLTMLAGFTLLFPGTALDRMWLLNPQAHRQMQPLGRPIGMIFPVLSLALASAGIGWLKRRAWGWKLAVLLIGMNCLGDLARAVMGFWLEGGTGVVIAGSLLFYLTRPRVRGYFS